jgi:hypothetical protein
MSKTTCAVLLAVAASFAAAAEDPGAPQDKTGTNPVNFQREFRAYNEFTWLNTAGDGSQNLTTAEFRTPILDGKWQWRVRARFNSVEADLDNDGVNELDDSGLGDTDMRFITVPVLDMAKRRAIAVSGGPDLVESS